MSLYVLAKENLSAFIEALQPEFRVVGPVQTLHGYAFDDIEKAEQLQLSYPTTILPPKKYFLPQRETLFEFHNDIDDHGSRRMRMQPVFQDVQPTVIFGVHTCDMTGIMLYDRAFATGYQDEHYIARREQIFVVGIECLHPCDESSFCKDMGTLTAPPVFDLHMTEVDGHYLIDTGSEKGEQLLLKYAQVKMATTEDIRQLGYTLSSKWPRFRHRLKMGKDQLPSLLTINYGANTWDEMGAKCLACGSCTNVCPTCFCFDVQDETEISMEDGERYRVRDSCQLYEFALVAGGHNFRDSKASRIRHRFMRKAKYNQQVHGLVGCTGCGRCERACLAHISIPGTLNALYEETQIDAGR